MNSAIQNKGIALITGASRGIGAAIAHRMAAKGYDLAIVGRNSHKISQLERDLESHGIKILSIIADLEDAEAPAQIIQKTIESFGKLDILINNAGIAVSREMEATKPEIWDKLMQVNAKAPYFIIQHALPHLRQSGQATIINISSVVGRLGYANQSAYAASKHAMMGFSKALAREIQKDNIRLHVLAPGGVNTDMVKTMRPDIDTEKLIDPDEIAGIVDFLVSNRGNAMIDNINIRRANGTPWA